MAQESGKLISKVRRIGDEDIEVFFRKSNPPSNQPNIFWPLEPSVRVEDGILIEHDVAISLSDGITLYADVHRPEGATNVPVILSWSFGGKNFNFVTKGSSLGILPEGTVSILSRQEGPDPAYWCHYGYAVIHVDPRGNGNSEGDAWFLSEPDARDCCEVIAWAAEQPWSNGRVGMHGTAFPGNNCWYAAAQKPPALACIAPWEAFFDFYEAVAARGGVLDSGIMNHMLSRIHGHGYTEDIVEMGRQYPFRTAYWEEKRAKIENIDIPVYMTASINLFHNGIFKAFQKIPSERKWLRTHTSVSWRELYLNENLEDLRRFFDRYLKNIRNGWELTPPVRLSLYDSAGDVKNRIESQWPPAGVEHMPLYLNATTGALSSEPEETETAARYTVGDDDDLSFTYRFDKDTEVAGYAKLRLWVEAAGSDDMDLFVSFQRLDAEGNNLPLPFYEMPHAGVSGVIRVSHRELDEERSTPSEPVLKHQAESPIQAGEKIPVEVPLWPLMFVFHVGEQLRITVRDHAKRVGVGTSLIKNPKWDTINRGEHIFHTGGKYDAHLLLPTKAYRG
ncbi:CocE/NonD family hydrolase [soil metagenome]